MTTTRSRARRAPGESRLTAALWLCVALGAPAAGAQPLLIEEFDVDENGWTAADGDSTLIWNAFDANNCTPDSGSVLAVHGGPVAGAGRNFVPPDCVSPITALAPHSFGVLVNFPAGQTRTGSARMVVVWTNAPACGGTVVGTSESADVTTATAGNWVATGLPATVPPAGAQSASVRVRVQKTEAGGALAMNFDRVFLARGSLIHLDGFETGSTCRWTLALP